MGLIIFQFYFAVFFCHLRITKLPKQSINFRINFMEEQRGEVAPKLYKIATKVLY